MKCLTGFIFLLLVSYACGAKRSQRASDCRAFLRAGAERFSLDDLKLGSQLKFFSHDFSSFSYGLCKGDLSAKEHGGESSHLYNALMLWYQYYDSYPHSSLLLPDSLKIFIEGKGRGEYEQLITTLHAIESGVRSKDLLPEVQAGLLEAFYKKAYSKWMLKQQMKKHYSFAAFCLALLLLVLISGYGHRSFTVKNLVNFDGISRA
jgi:hypothetical protein